MFLSSSLLLEQPGFSQDGFNVQLFRPSPFYGKTLFLYPTGERSLYRSNHELTWDWQLGLIFNYQNDAFISSTGTNTLGDSPNNTDLLSGNFLASIEATDWLAFGLDVAFHPLGFDFGFDQTTGFSLLGEREDWIMGNINGTIRIMLMDQQHHALNVGVLGIVILPTGDEALFLGDENVQGGGFLLLGRSWGRFHLTGNFGYETLRSLQHFNLNIDDQLVYGAGLSFDLNDDVVLLTEARGRTTAEDLFETTEQSPLEVLVAGKLFSVSGIIATLGSSFGLINGFGISDVRFFAGIQYSPKAKRQRPEYPPDKDSDGDGIVDRLDACPQEAEDKDGVLDQDGCPEDYWIRIRTFDENRKPLPAQLTTKSSIAALAESVAAETLFEVPRPGKYRFDVTAENYRSRSLQVVVQPTDYLVTLDVIMVPAEDKDKIDPLITFVHHKLTSRFDFDSDVVPPGYHANLDSIAKYLVEHPAIRLVQLEGHADATGPEEYNLGLSLRRAASIKRYLVTKGVESSRIQTKGYGESKPVAENTTPSGRQKNRRVEIVVLETERR